MILTESRWQHAAAASEILAQNLSGLACAGGGAAGGAVRGAADQLPAELCRPGGRTADPPARASHDGGRGYRRRAGQPARRAGPAVVKPRPECPRAGAGARHLPQRGSRLFQFAHRRAAARNHRPGCRPAQLAGADGGGRAPVLRHDRAGRRPDRLHHHNDRPD